MCERWKAKCQKGFTYILNTVALPKLAIYKNRTRPVLPSAFISNDNTRSEFLLRSSLCEHKQQENREVRRMGICALTICTATSWLLNYHLIYTRYNNTSLGRVLGGFCLLVTLPLWHINKTDSNGEFKTSIMGNWSWHFLQTIWHKIGTWNS